MPPFAELGLEDRLAILIVSIFKHPAITPKDKNTVYTSVLREQAPTVATAPEDCSNEALQTVLARNSAFVRTSTVVERYFSRRMRYLEGGPPYLRLSSPQISNDEIASEITGALATCPQTQRLAQACLIAAFRSPTVLEKTTPTHAEFVPSEGWKRMIDRGSVSEEWVLDRARQDFPDNLLLNDALAFLSSNLDLLNNEIAASLIALAASQREHISYGLASNLLPHFGQLPEELQVALLRMATADEIRHHGAIPLIVKAILAHYEKMSESARIGAKDAFDRVLRLGWLDAIWPIIQQIREGIADKSFGCALLDDYPTVLTRLVWHGDEEIRGNVAGLWAGKSSNPYPEIEDVYLRCRVDSDEFVRDCMTDGVGDAYHKHWYYL